MRCRLQCWWLMVSLVSRQPAVVVAEKPGGATVFLLLPHAETTMFLPSSSSVPLCNLLYHSSVFFFFYCSPLSLMFPSLPTATPSVFLLFSFPLFFFLASSPSVFFLSLRLLSVLSSPPLSRSFSFLSTLVPPLFSPLLLPSSSSRLPLLFFISPCSLSFSLFFPPPLCSVLPLAYIARGCMRYCMNIVTVGVHYL